MEADKTLLAITGAVALLLQLLLAPVLTFGDAVPGFIVAAVLCVVVLFPDERHYVFAFAMGLLADLVGQAPVGSTAFCLLACAFALPIALEMMGNDNILMTFLALLAGALGVELLFCGFLAVSGILGFVDGIVHVALPCALYDAVIALLVCLVARHFIQGRTNHGGGVTMSNLRFR